MFYKILKLAVSGALVAWLLSSVDLVSLRDQLAAVDWQWVVYANLLIPIGVCLGVWRWQILLDVNRLRPGFGSLVNYWLVGQFFSNFLPSTVGGDFVKATLVARRCGPQSWPHAASSVLVARLIGLFGMFLVLPLGVALNIEWVTSLKIHVPLIMAFAGLLVLSVFVFSDLGNSLLRRCEAIRFLGKFVNLVRRLHDSILIYRGAPRSLMWGLAISGAATMQSAVQVWLLIQMFPNVEITWTSQIIVFTVASLMAMIPITLNGYGVQEGSFTVLLVSLGLTPSQGLLVAIAYRLISLLVATAGGIVFALSGRRVREVVGDAERT